MKKSVIYSRVSTNEQSYDSQITDLKKYAKAYDIEVIETFNEKVSGYDLTKDRDEYDAMKEFVIEKDINLILCWELSRFGRNTLHTLNEIEYFKKHNIDIYFKKENINTLSEAPTSKLLITLLSSIAEMERETIVSRYNRGKIIAAEQGKRIGFATLPYGFDVDEKGYLIINETEAEYIRFIYNSYKSGVGVKEIASKLNSMNVPTRRNIQGRKSTNITGDKIKASWRVNTIRKILHSQLYKGKRIFKETTEVNLPQIIDNKLWQEVQDLMSSHIGYSNANRKYEYLFKGKIYCSFCKHKYAAETRARYGRYESYYYCYGRKEVNIKCQNGQIASKHFDDILYKALFQDAELIMSIYSDKAKDFNVDEKNNQIEYFNNEIEKENLKLKRLVFLYRDGYITKKDFDSDNIKSRNIIINYQNNIKGINKEIKAFKSVDVIDKLYSLIYDADYSTKREYVLNYIDKIEVFRIGNDILEMLPEDDENRNTKSWYKSLIDEYTSIFKENERIFMVEVFVLGENIPITFVLGNISDECYRILHQDTPDDSRCIELL